MMPFPKKITIGDKYGPAMEIKTQPEADAYFTRCVEHSMTHGLSREEAERLERQNLGYYAGYCDSETAVRVQKLYSCTHPIFGSSQPTTEEALSAGVAMAETD